MDEIMISGEDIIIDDMNYLRKLRDRWREKAAQKGYTAVVIFIDTSTVEIQRRKQSNTNVKERHDVQNDALLNVINNFEYPSEDEHLLVFKTDQDSAVWLKEIIYK